MRVGMAGGHGNTLGDEHCTWKLSLSDTGLLGSGETGVYRPIDGSGEWQHPYHQ